MVFNILFFILLMLWLLSQFYIGRFYKNREKLFLLLIMIALVLIYAFRNNITTDSKQYAERFSIFNQMYNIWPPTYFECKEPLDVFCNLLVGEFTDNPIFMQLFYGVFIVGIPFWFFIKYSNNIYLSVFFYYALGFYFDSMNVVRNVFVATIFLFSLNYLLQKKYIKALLVIILCGLIHRTCFAMILVWAIIVLFTKYNLKYSDVCITLIIGFVFLNVLLMSSNSLSLLLDKNSITLSNINRTLPYLSLSITNIILSKLNNQKYDSEFERKNYLAFCILNLFLFGFAAMSIQYKLLIRFSYFFIIPAQVLLTKNILFTNQKRKITALAITLAAFFQFVTLNGTPYQNYQFTFLL